MENFLKGRQEREEARLGRAREISEVTVQRRRYEEQAAALALEVRALVGAGQLTEAQTRLTDYRTLVQDTANSISLTTHEMARTNASLAELQQLIDQASAAPGEGEGEGGGAPRKFKFSAKAKAKVTAAPTAIATVEPTTASAPLTTTDAGVAVPEGARVYGPCGGGVVMVRDAKAAAVRGCRGCTIYALPIAGSAFLSDCNDCTVYIACHQLRLKSCRGLRCYVWCASTPIIESCTDMSFGPYRCWRGLLTSATADGKRFDSHAAWVAAVGEMEASAATENHYMEVSDFQWLRRTASPHWRVMGNEEWVTSDTVFTYEEDPGDRVSSTCV